MVQWTAEKDQMLLRGIFQFNDIKFSQPLLKHLAETIGEDCTPKAVSHRLNNIKNLGKPTKSANDVNSMTSSPAKKTPTKKGAATPRSGKSVKSAAAKKNAADAGEDGQGPFDGSPTPSPRKRGRLKKSSPTVAKEDDSEAIGEDGDEEQSDYFDAEHDAKKIKVEKYDASMSEAELGSLEV